MISKSNFIQTIAPLIIREGRKRGYSIFSPIIAQAVIESNYGQSKLSAGYHNYFGMKCGSKWKGKSVNMKTKEEYSVGTLTTIKDNFRAYDTIEEGVAGYFDFINTKRYANLKTARTSYEYCTFLKLDGYATSSKYVSTLYNTIKKLDLEKYDGALGSTIYTQTSYEPIQPTQHKSDYELADEVIQGKWGNGKTRKMRLEQAGYDYKKVQKIVNERLGK